MQAYQQDKAVEMQSEDKNDLRRLRNTRAERTDVEVQAVASGGKRMRNGKGDLQEERARCVGVNIEERESKIIYVCVCERERENGREREREQEKENISK